jgi:hypothetical protein
MKAMLLREITSLKQNETPLSFTDVAEPQIGEGEVLLRVIRCGVCHTELDEIEGRTPPGHLPVILGHQVVGIVEERSSDMPGRPPPGGGAPPPPLLQVNAWVSRGSRPRAGIVNIVYRVRRIFARSSKRRDAISTVATRSI